MASQPAPSQGGVSAADVRQLEEELERLRAFKVVAERNLEEMGFSLQEALRQGWVSKRAETRRRRLEKKKAKEAAKWAKNDEYEAWLRKERKKAGLPVRDPTPAPSEAAYLERVAEAAREEKAKRLRNRVRRMSHQLLIAAAIRKQYREINMADQSGHVVPGADQSGPLKHRRFDARSETSMSATEAMARSFRNWAHKEKKTRLRSRSHTPETVVVSSRTTGPEDSPSGSDSDSPFTDDDASSPGPQAFRAVVYDPSSDEDDISDDELDELDFDNVSDEVLATAYTMLATAQHTKGEGDWANTLADNVLATLLAEKPNTPPSTTQSLITDTESSDTDSHIDLMEEIKQAINFSEVSPDLGKQMKATAPVAKHSNNKIGKAKAVTGKNKASKTQTEILQGVQKAIKHLNKQHQSEQKTTPKKSPKALPKKNPASIPKETKYPAKATQAQDKLQRKLAKKQKRQQKRQNDEKGPSRRAPNKPAAPSQSVYDPTWWRVNVTDSYDGVWASKVLPQKQPTDKMEMGFVTWAEQESRFPRLDERLELKPVPSAVIFNPDDVSTHAWDPLNRAVTEPKTGLRHPIHLGPLTVHSLTHWGFGTEYSLDPVVQPDNPSVEDKKRSLPSATLSKPPAGKKKMAPYAPGVKANMAVPTSETTPVASVHYPLQSPTATSISKPEAYASGYAAVAASSSGVIPGPSTPYPQYQPETPTVALYEPSYFASGESSDEEGGEKKKEEQDALESFLQKLYASASVSGTPNANGKRTAASVSSSTAPTKKRRTSISSDSEKENGAGAGAEPEVFEAAAKEFWTREAGNKPFTPSTPGSVKKSVRFDVGNEGPSYGMRYSARRALGRYGRTSSRRGPYR